MLWLLSWAVVSSGPAIVLGAIDDWAEGTPGKGNGASRDCYNLAAQLEWRHKLGDWRDAKNAEQGSEPFAVAIVNPEYKGKMVEWDVQRLSWRHPTIAL